MKNCEGKSDNELVQMSLEDPDYFLCLMKRYELRLMVYIKRLLGVGEEDAEDILQEVFIKTYRNLNDFDSNLKFSSWIYRITHNHAISSYRKFKKRMNTLSLEDSAEVLNKMSSDLDIEKEVEQELLKGKMTELLMKLDHKYREVLLLKFLEDKDYGEISDILKKPSGTVATLINRAKSKFKEILIQNNISSI
jgi:RNA polymerase sigma-70 factor (ECF subfamily)